MRSSFYAGLFLILLAFAVRSLALDARSRGKSPLLVILLVLLTFPLGLVAWLVFRPDRLHRRGSQPLAQSGARGVL